MSDAPTRIAFLWDCEHGCPPIQLHSPIDATDNGDGTWTIMTTERGSARNSRAVIAHLRLVHGHGR